MDSTKFQDTVFGRPAIEPGNRWAFTYYLPRPIPRNLELPPTVVAKLSEADAALGQLAGLATIVTEPNLLIGPYLRREAVSSSRIEGTQTSLSEVFESELQGNPASSDVREVQQYLAATNLAYSLLASLPITQRLILQVHAELLTGVRGEEKSPGELRRSPVWVGSAGATPETSLFVPPLPVHLGALMSDWESFVNDDGQPYPALIQAALAHYQFETIHPFLDGNGRVGRLIINLILMERQRLPVPLLYLSSYFESHREQYYDALQAVREAGAIDDWFAFFLDAVRAQAKDAIGRSRQLVDIRQRYLTEASQNRSRLPLLVDVITRNPFVTVRSVREELTLSDPGARALIRSAEANGWLKSRGTAGRGGRETWFAPEILKVMESPMSY